MIALHEKYVLVVPLVNYLLTVYLRLHFSFKICFPPSRTPSFSSVTNSNCVDLPACFFLKMNRLMPFSLSYIKKMGSITGMYIILFETLGVECR